MECPRSGDGDKMRYYSLESTDYNAIPAIQKSEFALACINDDINAVQDFINGRIHVDQRLRGGYTALMFALEYAHPRLVHLLLKKGANVNYQCPESLCTPLMALACTKNACEGDIIACLRCLDNSKSDYSVSINSTNNRRDTALIIATVNNHHVILRWLANNGASPNVFNKDAMTALDIASGLGKGDLCSTLLRSFHNVDITQANDEGLTACEIAKKFGSSKIAGILYKIQVSDKEPYKCLDLLQELEHCIEQKPPPEELSIGYRTEESSVECQLTLSGLPQYASLFRKHKIDFESFLTLDQEKLIEMGNDKIGARFKILESVYKGNSQEYDPSCLPRLHHDFITNKFSSGKKKKYTFNTRIDPDTYIYRNANAIAYYTNISRQLDIMNATINHIKSRIKNFTNESTITTSESANKDKIQLMKSQLRHIKVHMKNIRKTEIKTIELFQSHNGRYINGEYIHDDDIVIFNESGAVSGFRRTFLMLIFRMVLSLVTPSS